MGETIVDYVNRLAALKRGNWRYQGIVSPEAWLSKHARHWSAPVEFAPIEEGDWKRSGECFKNAYSYAMSRNLRYVEGYATNLITTEHAWCVTSDNKIVDPTWSNEGVAYFGAEIPFDKIHEVQRITGVWGVLCEGRVWTRIVKILLS